jgi:hypothetical protein
VVRIDDEEPPAADRDALRLLQAVKHRIGARAGDRDDPPGAGLGDQARAAGGEGHAHRLVQPGGQGGQLAAAHGHHPAGAELGRHRAAVGRERHAVELVERLGRPG